MDSYVGNNQFNPQQQQAENQNPGLLRFRSAPSSLFANFRDGFEKEVPFRYTHDSSENLVSGFGCGGGGIGGDGISAVKMEGSERIGQVMGQSHQLPPQYPKQQGLVRSSSGAMDQSIGRGLNLSRQSSSPAGFFDHVNGSNGYSMMKGTTNYRLGSSPNASESSPRASRFKAQIDFKSVLSPPMSHLPQIPEVGTEIVHESSSNDMKFMNHESEARFLDSPGFSFPPWNDPGSDGSQIPIPQNGGLGGRSNVLSHQLSMPNTSAEMAAIEKLLHFQDTVPFKVRAKRGCATHPRSIAERERRNRISERMRKLQDLVPNMDKQTNTADMLDLAVEYIKDLQRQHKNLSESRARCRCPKLS